jgi:hypothetical protein
VIAVLRMAFVSSGNRQGNWAFRIVHGRPPNFATALELLRAAKIWILVCAGTVTLAAGIALRTISPWQLLTWPATAAQILVAGGMCLLLTDLLLLSVTTVAFTGEPQREQPNLAFTLLKYFTFFPFVSAIPLAAEPWVQESTRHMFEAGVVIAALHLALELRHRTTVRIHCDMPALEDDEEDFPMKLGLRY